MVLATGPIDHFNKLAVAEVAEDTGQLTNRVCRYSKCIYAGKFPILKTIHVQH